jgi:hypothetical protein
MARSGLGQIGHKEAFGILLGAIEVRFLFQDIVACDGLKAI